MSRDEFVSKVVEDLERRKHKTECHYVGNPYFEYVRERKTRKRRNLKRKFYR